MGGRATIVASHANIATALGIAMTMLAALKKASASGGMPVANMWCTQTPKPRAPVTTVASATNV